MGTKKYFWLKLKQDFFSNLRMKKLRSIAGGDTYTIIYLKMQLLSLQDEGFLYYEGVEESFEQEIALLIDENIEDVKITINFLKANGLLNQIDTEKYELIETKTCIGSETDKAEFMRRLREKKNKEKIENSNNVTNMLPNVTNCYTDIDIDIDKDIDIKKENKKRKKFIPPTIEEIEQYIDEKQLKVDGQKFYEYFEEGGWKDSKGNQVKNWKQKLLTWNRYANIQDTNKKSNYEQRQYDDLDFLIKNKI
jgi:predicted phage replisome organizer